MGKARGRHGCWTLRNRNLKAKTGYRNSQIVPAELKMNRNLQMLEGVVLSLSKNTLAVRAVESQAFRT